tara:strand:- start:102 stop:1229 length:1128 start_codon:yes stop_codon:yes gene_type:complete
MTYAPFSKYLKLITGLCSFSLIMIAIINYTANPGNIYPPILTFDSHNKPSPKDIVEQLVQSDHGVIIQNDTWNERDIKHALALHPTNVQCAVIGSSHVMQVRSTGQELSLPNNCPSLINLAVSGATLEDYLALSETILRNERPPRVIVFGIDPWSLNFNRDLRWIRYKQDFFNMQAKLEGEYHGGNSSSSLDLLRNLINREYLQRSVQLMLSERQLSIKNAPEFDHQIGLDDPVLLPDGSLVYSGEYIRNALASKISGINDFRIRGSQWVTEKAVELFTRLVNHLQQKKFKVIFVLVPYHPSVWDSTEQSAVTAMKAVESKVHKIARSTGVQVIGSYNPGNVECTADEFFDAAHGKNTCLAKLERASASYNSSKK